jgi:hypothetical protein
MAGNAAHQLPGMVPGVIKGCRFLKWSRSTSGINLQQQKLITMGKTPQKTGIFLTFFSGLFL